MRASVRDGLEMLLVGDHDAAQHVAVAGQIFGRAVHHDARAQLERPHQQRRRESVVDNQRRAGGAARSRRSCRSAPTRSSGFEMVSITIAPGLVSVDRCFDRRQIANVDEVGLDADAAPKMFISMLVVAPYNASAASTRLGRSISAASTARCSAAMPEAQATRAVRRLPVRAPIPPARVVVGLP